MKVFISWSGDVSRQVAETLRKYLPLMIHGLEPFMSKHDIESGSRWSIELAKELEDSSYGILCLTRDNLNSQWLLFEAGALTKHVEARACGLLVGDLKSTDVSGPLSQFQNRVFSKEEFRALVEDINKRLEKPLGEAQIEIYFSKFWDDIEGEFEAALKSSPSKDKKPPRDQQDILEEILARVRSIEGSVDRGQSGTLSTGLFFPRRIRNNEQNRTLLTRAFSENQPDESYLNALRLLAELLPAPRSDSESQHSKEEKEMDKSDES